MEDIDFKKMTLRVEWTNGTPSSKRKNMLIFCFPGAGHLNPCVSLCLELLRVSPVLNIVLICPEHEPHIPPSTPTQSVTTPPPTTHKSSALSELGLDGVPPRLHPMRMIVEGAGSSLEAVVFALCEEERLATRIVDEYNDHDLLPPSVVVCDCISALLPPLKQRFPSAVFASFITYSATLLHYYLSYTEFFEGRLNTYTVPGIGDFNRPVLPCLQSRHRKFFLGVTIAMAQIDALISNDWPTQYPPQLFLKNASSSEPETETPSDFQSTWAGKPLLIDGNSTFGRTVPTFFVGPLSARDPRGLRPSPTVGRAPQTVKPRPRGAAPSATPTARSKAESAAAAAAAAEAIATATETAASDAKVTEWLDAQKDRSVVYVALGSWCMIPEADLTRLALALEMFVESKSEGEGDGEGEKGQQKCLWAYRGLEKVDYFEKTKKNCETGVERAADGLPVGFREKHEKLDTIKIVPWVNQIRVLAHPAIQGFITHGGWNSLSETMYWGDGLPVLVLPLDAEQAYNAHLVHTYYQFGLKIWENSDDLTLTPEAICEKLHRVLTTPSFKERAQSFHRIAKQALLHRDAALRNLLDSLDTLNPSVPTSSPTTLTTAQEKTIAVCGGTDVSARSEEGTDMELKTKTQDLLDYLCCSTQRLAFRTLSSRVSSVFVPSSISPETETVD